MERSAIIAGEKPARSASERLRMHAISGSKLLSFNLTVNTDFSLSSLLLSTLKIGKGLVV